MLDVGDLLRIQETSQTNRFLHARVDSITDNTGWWTLGITPEVYGSTAFINGRVCEFTVERHSVVRSLYAGTTQALIAADETAVDQISGANVLDAEGTLQPVGLGVVIDDATNWGNGTITPFQQVNAHQTIDHDDATATLMNTSTNVESGQTDIPPGAQWEVKNAGAGALTIAGGTRVTLYW